VSARIDHPDVGLAGVVEVTVDADFEYCRRHLVAILAGPREVGRAIPYPPDPGAPGDEGAAGLLAGVLALDAPAYFAVERRLEDLRALDCYRRGVAAVAGALLELQVLTGEQVGELVHGPA
jgi:hypothetical protein